MARQEAGAGAGNKGPGQREGAGKPPGERKERGVPGEEERPGGRAQYDPKQQTRREDLPEREQPGRGERLRGNRPPE